VTAGQQPGVVVRRVVPDDWQQFREVRLAALADAPSAFLTTYEQAAQYDEQVWRLRAAEGGTMLAWRGDRPVGIAAGFVPDEVPELVMMWVEPAARGTGVVEALIDSVATWAGERAAGELRLWVVDGNERAERAYDRYGFRRTGRAQPVPGRPDETEVEMSLSLEAG
jgi:GNAT superfamily N-acetyltransferase